MSTPSLSLVESLIGAIPVEEGAALVARVGERATITAKSGSIEVGSVALTVEAMDDLIAQVLPPDQLESLQENGTVHFEFTPPVLGGEFAVLAASTPGDRWLEIRRRSTVVAPPPAAAAPARPAPAPVPAPPAPAASVSAGETDVAKLLSRFQTPDTSASASSVIPPFAVPEPPVLPPSFTTVAPPPAKADFDLSATMAAMEPLPEPPQPPPVMAAAIAQDAGANDDLTLPANLEFAVERSDFDLDGLSLPETLPGGPAADASGFGTLPDNTQDLDHIGATQSETIGMAKSYGSTSTSREGRSRSVVMLSVVLGVVALGAGGWFAAQRYLSAPSAENAAPPPPPPPRRPVQPKAATAAANAAPSPAPAGAKPVTAAAPKSATNTVAQKSNVDVPTPKPVPVPTAPKATAPAPTAPVSHEGYAVQVAAVRERDEADRIVARLVNQGYPGYLVRGQGSAAAYFRVRVGAKDRREAEEVAARLERAEGVKPWIVKETP